MCEYAGSNRLNIVITDRDTVVCDGDIDLSCLEELGRVTSYGETPAELVAQRIAQAHILVINKTVIGKAEIDQAKNLRLIALFATGYNNVDVEYAKARGIAVANAGVYSTSAVAQQVFGYILGWANRIFEYDSDVKNGEWIRSRLFCFFSRPTQELAGKTLGIFGYGAIGKRVAELGRAFEMEVIACTRSKKAGHTDCEHPYVRFVEMDELLRTSDYLTLHCPLTPQTREIFDLSAFSRMKREAYFINTSRGGVIKEADLAEALGRGLIAGAAVDVLAQEPMSESCPLAGAPNLTITPHIAWAPIQTRRRLLGIVYDNIRSFLDGQPKNIVNP